MSKFNLKMYQKVNGDEHITKRLSEQHDEAPEVVTEKQLEKGRVKEEEVILEKLLEKSRTGSADRIIEKNLNDSKGLFAPLRNSDTHTGNINKLEEKRISGDKTEDEKYEAASETPKSQKWWEHLKQSSSAKSVKSVKTAAGAAGNPRLDQWDEGKAWQTLEEETGGQEPEEGLLPDRDPTTEFMGKPEDAVGEEDDETTTGVEMDVVKHKESREPIPTIYYLLEFDPEMFGGDIAEAKSAAMEKVLELNPNLEGKISIDDFSVPRDFKAGVEKAGQLALRLIGPEYFEAPKDEMFSNLSVEQVDDGGTPVTVGRLSVGNLAKAMESGELTRAVVEYILEQDDSIADVDTLEKSLNLSALDKGEITFAIGTVPDPEGDEGDAGTEEGAATIEGLEGTYDETDDTGDEIPDEDFPVTETGTLAGEDITDPMTPETPEMQPPPAASMSDQERQRILEDAKRKEGVLAYSDFPIITAELKKK